MDASAAAEHREVLRLMQAREWRAALEAIGRAVELEPGNPSLHIHRAHCLLALGRRAEALAAAQAAEGCARDNALIWDSIGTLRSFALEQRAALAAYDRAVALAPQRPAIRL